MVEIFTIIAPVFAIMFLGYGLGKTSLFPDKSSDILITFVWYVAIPALMFRAIASADLPTASELLLVVAYYGSLLLLYAIALLVSKLLFKLTPAEQGIFALSSCFANGGFIGIPLMEGAFGDEGVRLLLVILSFHSLTLLTTTTLIVERALSVPGEGGVLRKTMRSIGQNPLLIALALGLTWSGLQLPFPNWLDKMLALPAASAPPVGLFAAGMALSNVKIAGDLKQALTAVGFKLLLLPVMVFVAVTYVIPLPPLWAGVAVLTSALPSGMVAYTFGSHYQTGARRAATTVMISTAVSVLTLSAALLFIRGG